GEPVSSLCLKVNSSTIDQTLLRERLHHPMQTLGHLRHRRGTDYLPGDDSNHLPHLPRRDPSQKRFPYQQRYFLGPALRSFQPSGQKTLPAAATHPYPDPKSRPRPLIGLGHQICRSESASGSFCTACLPRSYTSPQKLSFNCSTKC